MYKQRKEKENNFHISAGKYLLTDNVAIQKKPFHRGIIVMTYFFGKINEYFFKKIKTYKVL